MLLRRSTAVIVLMLAFLMQTVKITNAETAEQMLDLQCPNGTELKRATDAADEAMAVTDFDERYLAQEAARQDYRCAHTTDSPYVHDWARFYYFMYLWDSFSTKGEVK